MLAKDCDLIELRPQPLQYLYSFADEPETQISPIRGFTT